jgi:hypothetical protein
MNQKKETFLLAAAFSTKLAAIANALASIEIWKNPFNIEWVTRIHG